MLDREKIIEAFDEVKELVWTDDDEYTVGYNNGLEAGKNIVLSLLKKQEKAKVVFGRCKDGSFATECGHCGTYLDKAYSICPKCNKELDWNSNQD